MSAKIPAVTPMSRAAIESAAHSFVAKVSPETLTGITKLPVSQIVEFRLEELFDVQFEVADLPQRRRGSIRRRYDGIVHGSI